MSSNGRTTDFGSVYSGSNPGIPAKVLNIDPGSTASTMGKYKALLSDVDGTIIIGKNPPTNSVISSIKKAHQYVHVGLSTARPLDLVKDLVSVLELTGPSIVNGGAQIVDVNSGESLWEQPILHKDLEIIFKKLDQLNIPFVVNDDGKDIASLNSYVPKNPLSVATYDISENSAEKVTTALKGITTISVHKFVWERGKTMGVSINHINATKQNAVIEMARLLCIKNTEIIGVGDSYNDFPLLMACGLKIAMGNSNDGLKEIADYIAPSVEEDGISDVIKKFVLS